MANLLELLRDFTMHNREIKEEGDDVIFHNYAWPKKIETNFIMWRTGKHGSAKEYYSLESIIFFLKNINLSHTQYFQQSAASNILIRLPDRKKLLDYLQGRISTCKSIDPSVLADISQRRLITVDNNTYEPPSKRVCIDKIHDEEFDHDDIEIQVKEEQQLEVKIEQSSDEKVSNSDLFQDGESTKSLEEHITTLKDKQDESELKEETKNKPEEVKTYMKIPEGVSKTFIKDIVDKEYTWSTRTSVLQSQRRTFFNSVVMGTLKSVKLMEENLLPEVATHTSFPQTTKINDQSGSVPEPVESQPPTNLSGYDQERFTVSEQSTTGSNNNIMSTYHDTGLLSPVISESPRGIVRRSNQTEDSKPPLSSMEEHAINFNLMMIKRVADYKLRVPIIIIPAGINSVITMYNAKDILQDLKFEETENKKLVGARRENEVRIKRQKYDGQAVPYRVFDQPWQLEPDDWDRVVAVFIQGPIWPFKNWPIGNEPEEIFRVAMPFHLKWAHMPLEPELEKYNVNIVELDHRRYRDKAIFQHIWDMLDIHMVNTKPHLKF